MDKRGKNAHLHGAKKDISRSPSARQFGVSAGTGAPHAPGRLAGPLQRCQDPTVGRSSHAADTDRTGSDTWSTRTKELHNGKIHVVWLINQPPPNVPLLEIRVY